MTPTLQGSLVTLRPMLKTDAQLLIDAAQDGELWTLPFTVVPSAGTDQRVIGSTRFWKIDRENRKLEIGHTWYSQSWQKTAANTESKLLLLRYAFEQLKCVRVQFTTDVLNERSQAAILRIGAVQESIIRNERIMPDGRKRTSIRYSIIDDEWPQVRTKLERRLSGYRQKK